MDTVHRLAVLYKGEIIEEDDPHSIYKNPQQTYTESLISAEYNSV